MIEEKELKIGEFVKADNERVEYDTLNKLFIHNTGSVFYRSKSIEPTTFVIKNITQIGISLTSLGETFSCKGEKILLYSLSKDSFMKEFSITLREGMSFMLDYINSQRANLSCKAENKRKLISYITQICKPYFSNMPLFEIQYPETTELLKKLGVKSETELRDYLLNDE